MKKKNWYKGLTATAITLAMAGITFTVPAMASDSTSEAVNDLDNDVSVSVNENLPDIYQPGGVLEHEVEYTDGDIVYIAPEDQSEGVTVQPGEPVGSGQDSTGEENTGEEATGEESTGEEDTGKEATGEEGAGEEDTGKEDTGEEKSNDVVPGGSDGGVTVGGEDDSEIDENTDWSCFYDSQTGHFKLTYTIEEDTDDELLNIDLTYALKLLNKYASDNQLNVDTLQPGDGLVYDIYITSNSGHTYKYLDGSFVLQTPDLSTEETGNQDEVAFDGQALPDQYLGKDSVTVARASQPVKDLLYELGIYSESEYNNTGTMTGHELDASETQILLAYFTDTYGENLSVSEYFEKYYLDYYGGGYESLDELLLNNQQAMNEIYGTSGNTPLKLDFGEGKEEANISVAPSMNYNNFYENLLSFVFGNEEDISEATGGLVKIDEGITGFKSENGTQYTIYNYNDYFLCAELNGEIWNLCDADGNPLYWYNDGRNLSDVKYLRADDGTLLPLEAVQSFRFEFNNDSWSLEDNPDHTVGDYMDFTSEAWNQANDYFNTLLSKGINAEQASWAAFAMAFNLDGELTGNEYQLTQWSWYNALKLERIDGSFDLTKVDENGETITTGETTFQLWYYEDTDGDNVYTENDDKYFLVSTEDNSYGFVKYDHTNTELTYTINTTDGNLHIDYALLEDIIYYLQEVVAPEGYEIDKTVQIICNEDQYQQAQDMLQDADIEIQTSEDGERMFAYIGAIDSEKPLYYEFVNVSVEEPPVITPDPPEIPEYPEIPDYNPPTEDIDDDDVPLVEEPEDPEEPTEEIDDEETPLTPSVPEEVVDEVIEDEVVPLTSVPKTGAEIPAATAALPGGVLALAVSALIRRIRRKG